MCLLHISLYSFHPISYRVRTAGVVKWRKLESDHAHQFRNKKHKAWKCLCYSCATPWLVVCKTDFSSHPLSCSLNENNLKAHDEEKVKSYIFVTLTVGGSSRPYRFGASRKLVLRISVGGRRE